MAIRLLQVITFILAVDGSSVSELPGLVQVLWSQVTPAEMLEATLTCELQTGALISVNYSSLSTPPPLPLPIVAVLDLLWSEPLSRIYLASRTSEIPVLNGNNYELEGTTALDLGIKIELEQLARVSGWLGVKRLCLFLSPQSNLLSLSQQLFSGIQIEVLRVSKDAGSAALDILVRKQIVPFGFTSFLILLPPRTTKQLLLAFHQNQLTKNRLLVLLSSKASAYRFTVTEEDLPGLMYLRPLYVTRRECTAVNTTAELLLCLVSQALSNPLTTEVSLMQIADRTVQLVAWVYEEGIDLSNYREAEIQPNSSKALFTIHISVNSGQENPSGLSYYEQFPMTAGALLAQEDINKGTSILPYFDLEVLSLSLGVDEFDAAWIEHQLAKSDLGIAMIAGIFSAMTIKVYETLDRLNYTLPQVGAVNVYSALSSTATFPLYTRVAMSTTYTVVLYGKMMKLFGWSHMCMLYASDTWDEELTEYFFSQAKELGIEVSNHNNKVPAAAQANSTEFLQPLQEVVDSKVRVLVLDAYGELLVNVLVALYDLGVRSGDLIIMATDWMVPSLYEIEDSKRLKAVKELTQGAIMFIPAGFIGSIGASVYQRYAETYGIDPPIESCFYYDAGMILAYALDDLIARGESWTSPFHLNKAIRQTRFIGCSGFVSIEEKTNDRALMSYYIINARMQDDESIEIQAIGSYDPFRVVLISFEEPIQWPGRGDSVPTDMRANVPGCPFEQKDVLDYQPAVVVSAAIISCVCLLAISSSVYFWKKYWNEQSTPLKVRAVASFQDSFVFALFAVEAVQYLAVGLNLYDGAAPLKWGANLVAVRFEAFSSSGSAGYWLIFYVAMAVVALWTVLISISLIKTSRFCGCICNSIDYFAQLVCPLLGEICFLPIVSILLAVFQCPKTLSKVSESASLYRAYLEWDCYQFCWSGSHLSFAILSFVCLLMFIPSAVFMRPVWQNLPLSLHIRTSPSFLMLKSIFQISIASVDRILKTEHSLSATVVFMVLTTLFGIGTLRVKPYNYSRANLWHFLSLLLVLHISVLHIVSDQLPEISRTLWLLFLFLGLSVIGAFGLIFQAVKLPMLLTSRKGIHVVDLFHFMFSRDGRYLHIFSRAEVSSTENEAVRRVTLPSIK